MQLQFLDFVVDLEARELRHRGAVVETEPKVFALIAYLCERPGRMIARETLLAEIWPGTATTIGSLTRVVSLARQALRDRRNDGSTLEIIETLRGRGYRFNPDIRIDRQAADSQDVQAGDPVDVMHQMEQRRAELFVGRRAELARLAQLLDPSPSSPIVYVFGPGGVGKSELLAAFARRCRVGGRAVQWIDAAQLDSSGKALREKFSGFEVVFLDTAEALGGLRSVLLSNVLPHLKTNQRVVMAGRDVPDAGWLADSRLRGLIETFELKNHSEADSRQYLRLRNVPDEFHAAVIASTFGHPLALGMVGELYDQDPSGAPDMGQRPDIIQSLLTRLLDSVPSIEHRRALWCVAQVRALPADLLAAMLPNIDPEPLFDWLMSLSFVRRLPEGLVPHDIARAILFADLNWRAPTERTALGRRALEYYFARVEREPGRAHELTRDFSHMYRNEATGATSPAAAYFRDVAKDTDLPELNQMVHDHEGKKAAALFTSWCNGPTEIDLLRDETGSIAAFQLGIWLDQIDETLASSDPGVVGLFRHLQSLELLESDRRVYYSRFWMARESHHGASPAAHAIMDTIWGKTLRYSLALGFFYHTRPEGYLKANRRSVEHWEQCDFRIDERQFAVLGHDFRPESHIDWVRRSILLAFDATTDS